MTDLDYPELASAAAETTTPPAFETLQRRAIRRRRNRAIGGVTAVAAAVAGIAVTGALTSGDVRSLDPASMPTRTPRATPAQTPAPTPAEQVGPSTKPDDHPQAGPTLQQIVADPRATLNAVAVHPGPEGYTVTAWWIYLQGDTVSAAIVTSDDGFRSASYEHADSDTWAKHAPEVPKGPGPAIDAFKGLLASPVTSLDPGTKAFAASGGSATLIPFQAVARSTDGGHWTGYSVPTTSGDRAYRDGALVLPDGRFLVLLDAWSSDRGHNKPGPEYHGLWISAGQNWARYAPYHPTFSPALAPTDRLTSIQATAGSSPQAPHGIVFATTSDNGLYVSTDAARTFRQTRAR